MDINETLEFIHSVSWIGGRLGLERITELLAKLGNPERECGIIHIAGTNGKGSTAAMLASVMNSAGYKTGLYTSPYIWRFNERMQIDGVSISDEELIELTELVKPHALSMADQPTEFELVTAIAFLYFARNGCDMIVLEVGMGGRLDATNVIESPECCAITAIGLDHVAELGDTIEKIAVEKAGIIKPGCDVVLYGQEPSVISVISDICDERGAKLRVTEPEKLEPLSDALEGQGFMYKSHGEYNIPLLGPHQLKNAAVVLDVIAALREKGRVISDEAIYEGLRKTEWPARFELLHREPYFIVDGGHNPQCAETVAVNLKKYFPNQKAVLLIGVLGDKDYGGLTSILDEAAGSYVAVRPDNPRALSGQALGAHLETYGKPVTVCDTIEDGVRAAMAAAGSNGVACAVGSLYMAGAVRACFGLG